MEETTKSYLYFQAPISDLKLFRFLCSIVLRHGGVRKEIRVKGKA